MRLKSVGMGYFLAIPDVISILNLVFGFLAILMVIGNHLTYASLCILVAVVFDSVDGWVSRKLNREDKFGFGKKTGIEITESVGVVPERSLVDRNWSKADTASASIGQGFDTATPVQMAKYISMIANGGHPIDLTLVKSVIKSNGTFV